MTLKLPNKQVSEKEIDELTAIIESVITQKVIINKPTENYKYCTWDIGLTNLTKLEIVDLITNLRKT